MLGLSWGGRWKCGWEVSCPVRGLRSRLYTVEMDPFLGGTVSCRRGCRVGIPLQR